MSAAFQFLRPAWLIAIPLFLALIWWHQRGRDRGGVWNQVIDEALLPYVLDKSGVGGGHRPGLVLALAATTAIVALAGPVWERMPVPVFRGESALVIALDLSASMNAQDIEPSRLAMAKFKIADLLNLRQDGQTALIVYAAQSFVVTPLTDDTTTLLGHLQGLDTSIMPTQGSEPATALAQAAALLTQAGVVGGHVLLVTDGTEPSAHANVLEALTERNYTLSVLGVGTAAGAPIPDRDSGFVKRANGELIMSALVADELTELVTAGEGLYLSLTSDDADVRRLRDFLESRLDDRAQKLDDLAASQWREFGPWLLLLLLPIAACGFRRGLIVAVALSCLPLTPSTARAEWWRTDDQAGAAAFDNGQFGDAKQRFAEPQWRGAAAYREGDYDAAVADFAASDDATAHYNRGNALARLGQYKEAIAAYDSVLERRPDDEDAAYNKGLLEKLLSEEEQPPPDKDRQSDQSPDTKQEKSDSNDNGEGQDGGGQGDAGGSQEMSGGNSQGGAEQDGEKQAESASGNESGKNGQALDKDEPTEKPDTDGKASTIAQSNEGQSESDSERAQATEQWLRQIPDDPAGLLRRKFQYQYKQRYGNAPYAGNRW